MCPTMASISKPNSRSKSPPYLSSVFGERKPGGPPAVVERLTNHVGPRRLTREIPNGGRKCREDLLPVAHDTEPG